MLATCFHARFLLSSFFDPEDGGDIFLRNVGCYQQTTQHYTSEEVMLANSFQAGFLLGLFFDPEDGGDMFL
jgi:hypothetical protein